MNKNTTIWIALILAAAIAPIDNPAFGQAEGFAKTVPSAVTEIRDGPSAAELAKPDPGRHFRHRESHTDAHRAGSSIAVIHKGEAYLFDVGAGSVRNAVIARYKFDIPSLYPSQICCVFMSHLHSDHTMDYSELAYTMWWRRREPLRSWGPTGLKKVNEGMHAMMSADTSLRTSACSHHEPRRVQDPDYGS